MFVYSIKLNNNKYYIGKTYRTDVEQRFQEHVNNCGSEWTKKYSPTELIEFYKTENEFEEDVLTKKYMLKYGIDNVRGGSYTKIILEDWQIKSLEQELRSAQNTCFNCGECGHFIENCYSIKLNKYLNNFTDEPSISFEINKLEFLRTHINIMKNKIQHIKYVTINDTNNNYERRGRMEQNNSNNISIEITPEIILKYNIKQSIQEKLLQCNNDGNRLYTSIGFISSQTEKLIANIEKNIGKSIYNDEIHLSYSLNNIIETIYKIYIYRIKMEKTLNKFILDTIKTSLADFKLDDKITEYDKIINNLHCIIEKLYEKYTTMI
jgi:predicted GIY-YIG superfamily endonuclease